MNEPMQPAYQARAEAAEARVAELEAELAELRANWAHDVSTLESLVVQDEAAFRRLRKEYENLVDTATVQRLGQVRLELDGAYDLLRTAAAEVAAAEAERDRLRDGITALADTVAKDADVLSGADDYFRGYRDGLRSTEARARALLIPPTGETK